MKKRFTLLLTLLVLCLSGCSGYSNHYKAFMFVHSNTNKKAYMTFDEFTGTYSFRLKSSKKNDMIELNYDLSLEEGSVNIYIDINGEKQLLKKVESSDKFTDTIQIKTNAKGIIYIIVETNNKSSNGSFSFNISE